MLNSPAYMASGNIGVSLFVGISGDFKVAQTVANGKICGVSQEGTRRFPSSGASSTDILAAIANEQVGVFGNGHSNIFLTLGGTVVAGNWLKSDANGAGVACTNTGATPLASENAGAVALQGGVAGDKIRIQVLIQPARA